MTHNGEHDSRLAQRVKDSLMANTDSAGVDVQVEERAGGTVRLQGIVDTLSQARAAEEIAGQVAGVSRVESDLAVHGEKRWTDKTTRLAIVRRMERNARTEGVGAEVEGGIITLVGHVPAAADEAEAIRMAQGVPGVTAVSSRIKVGEGDDSDDALVARQARRSLAQMGLEPGNFTVWCDAGTLCIRGLVASQAEAVSIKHRLRDLDGVHKLDALLPVDPDVEEVHAGRGGKEIH